MSWSSRQHASQFFTTVMQCASFTATTRMSSWDMPIFHECRYLKTELIRFALGVSLCSIALKSTPTPRKLVDAFSGIDLTSVRPR